jgi:transcriptional regulator with XRE-family HTH domain
MAISPLAAFELCRQALGTTQEELGRMLGVSRRTAQRWTRQGIPSEELPNLARLVHAKDAALAAAIVAAAGTTLEAVGIVKPAAPPPLPPPLPDWAVDAVVCATAEAMHLLPNEVRPGLHAAFARAKEIGLSVDVIERVLRSKLRIANEPPPAPSEAQPTRKRKDAAR